ncbi:hypothetical protein G9A89_014660 [Geosiphon pyriformis]|nr:hypothetical protein G9A89_014660 [Geosiphon pyriformis]
MLDYKATIGPSIAVLNKSIIEPSFNIGVKSAESKKKRRSGVLEDNIGNKKFTAAKVSSSHSWSSETGNTTEFNSVNMEKECLVEETSFDFGEGSATVGRDLEQTSKNSKIQTKRALGKLLGKIDFLGDNDDDDNILLNKPMILSPFFEKFDQCFFIRAMFTSKLSLVKATKLTTDVKILINTNLKKSSGCSDQAVVVKKISVRTLVEAVCAVLSEFGIIKSVKIQLSILIEKDVVCVVRADLDKQMWDSKDLYKTLLYTLPVETNAYNIWNYIGSVDEKTCVIDCHPITYARARCAIVCFGSAELLDAIMDTISVLRGAHFCWSHLDSAVCVKCDKVSHISLNCASGGKISSGSLLCWVLSNVDKNRLAAIYTKCLVPVSRFVFFGSVSWAKIVVGLSFSPFSVQNVLLNNGFSLEMKPILHVSLVLNDRFAALECSLVSLAEHVNELAKRLEAPGLTVFQLSLRCQSLVNFSSQNQRANIVMSESSDVATGGEAVVGVVVFDPAVISKIEEILNNFLITVMSLLAKIDNAGSVFKIAMCNVQNINVPAKHCRLWIKDKFDGVWVFTSGLDISFLGAEVAIIMNISLACHVCKISEVSSWVFSIKLFFKNKLSMSILGLYAGASLAVCFTQAGKINFLIAKAVNESSFVILGGDFNENGSYKCTSFKKCSDFGLVNFLSGSLFMKVLIWSNFQDVSKIIDYVFVFSSLANTVVHHGILDVSEHFDTDVTGWFSCYI